jgi:hypothetical protein
MFTRSTLPMLAAFVMLVCGSRAGAEAFDPDALVTDWMGRRANTLSSAPVARGTAPSLRSARDVAVEWWQPAPNSPISMWPESAPGKLSFHRNADERAGSSALLSLGRLNLSEPRIGAAPGSVSQADFERELAQMRESVSRVRPAPQVSLGMRVKF